MMLLDAGLNQIRDDMDSDVDYGEVGLGVTASDEDDTDIEKAPSENTKIIFTSSTTYDRQLEKKYTLPTTIANGDTITEYRVYNNTDSITYTRVVFDGILKDGDTDIIIETIYFIDRE